MLIKNIEADQRNDALLLVEKTFMEYEAPDYSDEGISSFMKILGDDGFINSIKMTGAFIDDKLVGIIATRNNGNHICHRSLLLQL
jgi:hypothetical protein